MVKNIVNSEFVQHLFYNLVVILFVLGVVAMFILKVAVEMQEVGLAIYFCISAVLAFLYLYFS